MKKERKCHSLRSFWHFIVRCVSVCKCWLFRICTRSPPARSTAGNHFYTTVGPHWWRRQVAGVLAWWVQIVVNGLASVVEFTLFQQCIDTCAMRQTPTPVICSKGCLYLMGARCTSQQGTQALFRSFAIARVLEGRSFRIWDESVHYRFTNLEH